MVASGALVRPPGTRLQPDILVYPRHFPPSAGILVTIDLTEVFAELEWRPAVLVR